MLTPAHAPTSRYQAFARKGALEKSNNRTIAPFQAIPNAAIARRARRDSRFMENVIGTRDRTGEA
jgi:hypothetical protein